MSQIEKLLEDLRKRLVETGTRNRLVHVNRQNKRAKAVPIINERSEDIFEILRVNETTMQFAARGTEEEEDLSGLVLSVEEEEDESRYTDKFLDTPFAPDTLQKKLLSIARDARTAEEEQGINILYLAMGFLTWFENEKSDVKREAPLILIPIDLKRNKRSSLFDVVTRDDDILTNLPLQERLLNDFGIKLPEIDDNEDWGPKEYFKKVSDAISTQTRWSIDKDGMQVGFFSFAKLLMLKDLEPENWSSNTLIENPIIQGLLAGGFDTEAPLFEDNDNLDEAIKFSDLLHVIDADASQTKVIQEVRSGRNLVVQGPPGTGKSQTITNILSAAVHDGKKVLFVAEKMAALDVVYRRMSNLGLKDLCAELHSRNANKRLFIEELASTLSKKINNPNQLQSDEEHIETRDQLNRISKSLHLKLDGEEFSPFDVLSKLIKLMGDDAPPPRLKSPILETMNEEGEKEVLQVIDEFVNLHDERKDFTNHPFRFVGALNLQPTELERVIDWIENILGFCQEFMELAEKFSLKHKVENPTTFSDLWDLKDFIETVEKAPTADESFWNICLKEAGPSSDFHISLAKALVWSSAKLKFEEQFHESVWDVDLPKIRRDIKSGTLSWFQRFFGPYRRSSNQLASFSKTDFPKSAEKRLTLIDALVQAQDDKKSFDKDKNYLARAIGDNWREENTNFSLITKCLNWLERAGAIAKQCSGTELVQLINTVKDDIASGRKVLDAGLLLSKNIMELGGNLIISHYMNDHDENEFGAVYEELMALSDNKGLYREWVLYDAKRKHLIEVGLEELLSDIDEGVIPIDRAKTEFIYALNEARWKRVRKERPALDSFSRLDRHEIVDRFREYETSRTLETRLLIKDQHLSQLPTGAAGEMGFLRGEIAKQRRHRPIRQVIKNAAGMVQRIKPVFLMSPVSVAQFLPPETIEFDMLVIDEASQVKPEDAIGAIARTKQVVVVGDTKQLPPTSFFDRLMENTNDDEEDDDETPIVAAGDMESILTLCDARGFSNSMLRWHYRSRDPSLIACSNDEFYENRLIIPPSPSASDPALGMSFNKVSGIYSSVSKGGGRRGTNQVEAEEIADRLLEISKNTPDYSVGIATFSKSQADMISEVLELKRRADPHLDAVLTDDGIEPVFIKNIENVQGDERDIILVSVGYGPHEAGGRLASMNFGPVNAEGGERRLNVLFTRARIACEIFCSFEPSDIDLNRSKKYGTQVFKKFLEFAKSGSLPLVGDEGGEPDSEFEEDVANVIRTMGYSVTHQVGAAGFKIDLGVKSKSNPNHYILAVECDGATYHSALWARERDRLRQEVLESYGWRFHRIWSTDWFYNRSQEVEKLKSVLEGAGELVLNNFLKGANLEGKSEKKAKDREPLVTPPPIINMPEYDIPKYVKANVSSGMRSNLEPHEMPIRNLKDILRQIVEAEGIVHIDEIARRYTNAMGKTRVGSRIQQVVEKAMKGAQKDFGFINDGDFWGTEEHFEAPQIRDRSEENTPLTKPEYLSDQEIIAAAKLIEADSGSVELDELIRSISRLLGYKRAGPDFRKRLEQVLNSRDQNLDNGE